MVLGVGWLAFAYSHPVCARSRILMHGQDENGDSRKSGAYEPPKVGSTDGIFKDRKWHLTTARCMHS
jgi:hypothetical protein